MPENTEQNSEVSEVDVSGFEQLARATAPTISESDTLNDQRFSFVRAVKQLKPEYAYTADHWILNELRENEGFRSSLVDNIINQHVEDDQEFKRRWISEDPTDAEWREEYRKGLNKRVFENITRNTIKGETAKESIIKHQFELSKTDRQYDIANPLSVVSSTPGEFENWLDVKEIKNNQVSEGYVRTLYESDDEFRAKVIQTQVRNFEQELGKRQHQGVFDPSWGPDAANEYAKAYAIYNRFGSEALTDYTNILQHYVPGARSQDNRVISALRRFKSAPQYRELDIFGYAQNFVESGLEFRTREPVESRPRDWNPFTAQTYYTPENTDTVSYRGQLVNFIDANLRKQSDGKLGGMIHNMIGGEGNLLDDDKPIDLVKAFDFAKDAHNAQGIKGFPTYSGFTYDIIQQSLRDIEGNYTFEDLIATLAANATEMRTNEYGEPIYMLDYNELNKEGNQHLRMIVDGLQIHTMGDHVMTKTGAKIAIEPTKQARRDRDMAQRGIFGSEVRPIIDEGRSIIGFEEHVPNNFRNSAAGALVGITNIVPEFWGGVIGGWGGVIAESLGAGDNIVEIFDNQRHKARDYYSGTMMDFTDPVWEPFGMPFSAPDIGVAGGTLLGYLTGINFLGKGAILGAGKLANVAKGGGYGTINMFSNVAAIRKAQNFREFYTLANRSPSRAAQAFRGTVEAVGKKLPYGVWPKFVAGSAAIETFTDPQYSLATLVTSVMPNSVNELSVNGQWNVDRMYRTGGHLTRWGMDFLAGETLGLLFDGMIGVSKLANDHTFRALRGKPKLGLEYDPATGKYKPESESRYYQEAGDQGITGARKYIFPEIQRFVYNVRNNVDNIPTGDIQEAAHRYATLRGVGPQDFGDEAVTQADVAAKFVGDANEFMHTLRDDFESIIRDSNEKYAGHARMNDDQIRQLTDEMYDEFMDTMASNVYSLTGKDRGWNAEVFARHLEDHPGDMVNVTPVEFQGETTLTRSQAQIASRRIPNSHVIEVSEGRYQVYQADPALWRFDLARRLRQFSQQPDDFDGSVNRHLDRYGLDVGRDTDVDDATRVIDTLESVQGVGFRVGDREGVISGFTPQGWQVRWDDGTDGLYSAIRGLEDDGVPTRPPDIKPRKGDAPDAEGRVTGYDKDGVPIREDIGLRGSQSERSTMPVLDVRSPARIMDDIDRVRYEGRQSQLDEVFQDPEQAVQGRLNQIKELMGEGRHDEADDLIREISEIRRGEQPSGEVIELPGVVRLQEIVEQDRAAYEAARAYSDPTDMDRIRGFHEERFIEGLRTKKEEYITSDIQMLRGMGATVDEIDEMINANFIGDKQLQDYYRNYNRSLDFGEGVLDDVVAARVDSRRAELIDDQAWIDLPEKVQQQMVDMADLITSARRQDSPQRLIESSDPEITAPRSWETSNERFRDNRPAADDISPREYAIQLAEDLGTGTVRDIAKLQKTRAGGSDKVPIRTMNHEDLVSADGRITPIKNGKGLVVRVEPSDGGMPYYAIGRKNNIRGFPTRFVADQNGALIHNQEWAFINPNVTQRPDGQLKRFNPVELPNGETVYREHTYGKYLLNVQNPIRYNKFDYIGRTLTGNDGKNLVVPGLRTDEILNPDRVFRGQVDAIEIIDPASSRILYRVVSPESQVLRHGKSVSTPSDQRSSGTLFESTNEPLSAGEVIARMSKTDGKLHSHAWLAVPGMIVTGGIGVDENGDLTTAAKVGLAIGAVGIGGVLIRSMRGNFKIRNGYDALDPKYKQTFDKFDWRKIAEDGTPIRGKLTDDESAMFNRLQGVPKEDYAMLRGIMSDYEERGIVRGMVGDSSEEIPEMSARMRTYRDEQYQHWSTGFGEDGEITPLTARLDQRARQEVEVIGLQLNHESTDLVTMHNIGHTFRESTGVMHQPVAWARIQKAPDGKLLLDELQVDNMLQKGEFGITGDVNRDLYSSVLDEVVDRAIRESGGEFYVTRGNMQASRYGDNPDTIALRDTANQRIQQRIQGLREEAPDVIIRDADTIESARRVTEMRSGYVLDIENPNRLRNAIDQATDPRTELGRAARTFGDDVRTQLDFMEALSRPDVEGTYGRFSIRAVDDGYGIRLSDESLERQAIGEFYESNELARRTFPRADEFVDFLKDGSQTRGVINFYDNTLPNIIRKRYGAEVVDAMGAPRDAYDSPGEAFHKFIVTKDGLANARNKTGKRINWELIGGSMGLVGLGMFGYNMEDIGRQPDQGYDVEHAGVGLGSAILMGTLAVAMFGRGRVRTKIGANIKGKVDKKLHNLVDKSDAKAIEIDGMRMERRELHELNAHFNPRDPESVNRMEKVIRGARAVIQGGRDVGDWFKNSAYTQAGIQHLRKISDRIKTNTGYRGRVISDDLIHYLEDAHNAPARIQAITDTYFNETLGHGAGGFRNFQTTRAPKIVNDILDTPLSEDDAAILFNGAVTRLLNRGAHRVGDRVVFKADTPPHVRQAYEKDGGEVLQRLDESLTRNTEAMDFVETLRHGYGEVRKNYLDLLVNAMGRRVIRFRDLQGLQAKDYQTKTKAFSTDDLNRMVEDWVTSKDIMTYREFVKTLDPDERQMMRLLKKNSDTFADIEQVQNMRRRFTDLEGRYSPQMVDFEKVNNLRQKHLTDAQRDPELMEGTGATTPDEYATIMMKEDFRQLNMKGDGRGLVGFDESTLSLNTREFDSVDEARLKLESIINKAGTDELQDEWSNLLGGRTLTNDLAEELGFVVRSQNESGESIYVLRQPEGIDFKEPLFETANRMNFDRYYNLIMLDPAIRKSNFLENPRNFHLPMDWMIDDPLTVWRRYSMDTGTRLHSLEYGIFDSKDFSRNLITPLEDAMKRNGYTPDQVDQTVTRVEEMHATQFGILRELAGKSPNDARVTMDQIRKNNAALQTYRNFDYMKRTYGFKYLNWFQLLVSTLPMTSSRALKSAMGMGDDALSQGGLKQLEEMFMDLHIIKEKDMSFRFDIQPGDPTGEHGSVFRWAQKNSQRAADTVSDFSLEKSALSFMGVDVGNTSRTMRMLTSSFHDTNVMNTAMNGWAFMAKGQEVSRIARQMQLQGITPDGVYRAADGTSHNWESIYRQLEDVGVSRHREMTVRDAEGNIQRTNQADYFIQKEGELTAFMDRMKNNHRVSLSDFDPEHADIVEHMWHFATETYHGTNRVMRPEKWNTPLGRTLSMYASFTFNIGMQNTKRRILDPMNLWIERYGFDADGNQQIGKMQLPRLMKAIRSGDEDALRAAGITDPKMAIAEFPLEAVDNARRGMAGMGFGIATYTTLDVMRDIYAYPVQAALGVPEEERFRRTRAVLSEGIINPYAPVGQQVTLADLFGGEADAQDMARMMAWGVGKLGQSSYGGMYMSPFDSMSKYGFRGVTSLAPSLGIADRFAADLMSLAKPVATLNFDELPGETAKFTMNNLPVIGSNVFTESRWSARDRINQYRKELRMDEEEGRPLQ